MKRRSLIAALSVLLTAIAAESAHAASTSPGKLAVYASTSGVMITEPAATVVTATIARGKKKRVLEVELSAEITGGPEGAGFLSVAPIVNGLTIMEPINAGSTAPAVTLCGNPTPGGCSVSFEYWLDLDAAEAAHPGVFSKQPLTIDGQVRWFGLGPSIAPVLGVVSLRARLQKK